MLPEHFLRTNTAVWRLWAEAGAVVAYRTLGMAGLWAVAPTERTVMLTEKAPAFYEAALTGTYAALAGKRPDQIAEAAIRPLSRKARANSRRLARRGPRLPGR